MRIIFMSSIFFICYLPMMLSFAYMPYMTRKTTSFGVSIPEEIFEDKDVADMRKRFTKMMIAYCAPLGFIAVVLCLVGSETTAAISFGGGMLAQMLLFVKIYLKFYKEMKIMKEKNNWSKGKSQMVVVDTGFSKKMQLVSPVWFVVHFIVIIATILAGYFLYDKIPLKIPMKYNLNGEVVRWANKSYRFLFFAPVMQTFITSLMIFIYWMIGNVKQQVDAENPEVSIERNRIFRYRWSAFIIYASLIMVTMFGYIEFGMILSTNMLINALVPLIFTGSIIVAAIVLSITTGQGGSRVKMGVNKTGMVINRDDDKYWKWGMFYYNPDDPALFLEKRMGIGWTNNWARPVSWYLIGGLVIFIFSMITLTDYLTK